jgi:hypothetical protein
MMNTANNKPNPFAAFAAAHKITLDAISVPARTDGAASDWDLEKARHWHVTLTLGIEEPGKPAQKPFPTMSTAYSMGCGLVERLTGGKWKRASPSEYLHKSWYNLKHMKDMEDLMEGKIYRTGTKCAGAQPAHPLVKMRWAVPTIEEVLESMQMDVNGELDDFESWAGDYGYDTDSRKAEKIFQACQREKKQLRAFLGRELFEEFLAIESD